jgi:hypothetical protein
MMAKIAIAINTLLADLNVGNGPWSNNLTEGKFALLLTRSGSQAYHH